MAFTQNRDIHIPHLGIGTHLFLDDYLIGSMEGLTRTVFPPRKHGEPVLPCTKEQHRIQPFVAVEHYDVWPDSPDLIGRNEPIYPTSHGLFRMWYSMMCAEGVRHAYAESQDGIFWRKPNLELVELDGSYENNILPTYDLGVTGYPISIVDCGPAWQESQTRFRFLGYKGVKEKDGAWALVSPDGIHWSRVEGNPVIPYRWSYGGPWSDGRQVYVDAVSVFRDPVREKFVAIHMMVAQPEDGYVGRSRTGPIRRILGQLESDDFVHWTQPRIIIAPDTSEDMTEFYGMTVLYRNGLYLGFVLVLRDDLPADENGPVEGIGWTELAISRDGQNWSRLKGKFLDRNLETGSWDHAMAWLSRPVIVGEEMFFYYGGYSEGHKVGDRQIGLARAPRDRFVALKTQAGTSGLLKTKTLYVEGNEITVNAKVQRARVAIADERGNVIPGYDFGDCLPIHGDAVEHSVQWRKGSTLPASQETGIQIWIDVQGGSLYAISITP